MRHLLVLAFLVLLAGCGGGGGGGGAASGSAGSGSGGTGTPTPTLGGVQVVLKLVNSRAARPDIQAFRLTAFDASGAVVAGPTVVPRSDTGAEQSVRLEGVPSGRILVRVEGLHEDGQTLTRAETTVTVAAGQTAILVDPSFRNTRADFASWRSYGIGGSGASDAATGDLDGDGRLEVVVAHAADGTVSVLGGLSDGFHSLATYPCGGRPVAVELWDVDKDGVLDAVIADAQGPALLVMRNDGTGALQAPGSTGLPAVPGSLAGGDLDGDGRVDAVLSTPTGQLLLLRGLAGGNFEAASTLQVGDAAGRVRSADLDGDGRAEVIVSTPADFTVTLLRGRAQWPPAQTSTLDMMGLAAVDLAFGDLDRNGTLDLCTLADRGSIRVFLNTGNGNFGAGSGYGAGGELAGELALVDLDRDSILDVALTIASDQEVQFLRGAGDGSFQVLLPDWTASAGYHPQRLVVLDVNQDGLLDLGTLSEDDDDLSLLLGDGRGSVERPSEVPLEAVDELAQGDFNEDGRADLVYSTRERVAVAFGDGTGGFAAGPVLRTNLQDPRDLRVADLDGDGHLDVAVSEHLRSAIALHWGDGRGGFQPADVMLEAGLGARRFDAGDWNGDGRKDLAICAHRRVVLLTQGPGRSFSSVVLPTGEDVPETLALGDFQGDGRTDLAVAFVGGSVEVMAGQGDGTFGARLPVLTVASPWNLLVLDADSDGRDDLAVTGDDSERVVVLTGGSTQGFAGRADYPTVRLPDAMLTADFNADGHPDLALGSRALDGDLTVLLGDGAGNFPTRRDFGAGVGRARMAAADFDSDGETDLAVSDNLLPGLLLLLGR